MDFYRSVRALLIWGKTGQITCVLSPFSGIMQKTILARYIAEATCKFRRGASAKTLCTAALSLFYSIAEYCTPVWCGSAHTRLIDNVLNDALRIVTGCLHSLNGSLTHTFRHPAS